MFHPDATWNHRNDDRLGGIKHGVDEIVEFLAESMKLTAGTLRPVPEIFMPDGAGHVAVLTRITGTRPDGRSFDDTQILLFTLADGRARTVDQFVGDPDRGHRLLVLNQQLPAPVPTDPGPRKRGRRFDRGPGDPPAVDGMH